jgi:hypothetical protein
MTVRPKVQAAPKKEEKKEEFKQESVLVRDDEFEVEI